MKRQFVFLLVLVLTLAAMLASCRNNSNTSTGVTTDTEGVEGTADTEPSSQVTSPSEETPSAPFENAVPWPETSGAYPYLVFTAADRDAPEIGTVFYWDIASGDFTRGEDLFQFSQRGSLIWDGSGIALTDSIDAVALSDAVQLNQPPKGDPRNYCSPNLCLQNDGDALCVTWWDAADTEYAFDIALSDISVPEGWGRLWASDCTYAAKDGDTILLFFQKSGWSSTAQLGCLCYLPSDPAGSTWTLAEIDSSADYYPGYCTTSSYVYCNHKLYISTNEDILVFDTQTGALSLLTEQLEKAAALFPTYSQLDMNGISVPREPVACWGNYVFISMPLTPLDCSAEPITARMIFLAIDARDDSIAGALVPTRQKMLMEHFGTDPQILIYNSDLVQIGSFTDFEGGYLYSIAVNQPNP